MPKAVELTEAFVRALKAPDVGQRETAVFDALVSGFFIKASSTGRKTYCVKYYVKGRQRKHTLGPAVPGRLHKARAEAAEIVASARAGKDLVALEKAAASRRTVGELVPEYLAARRGELGKKTFPDVERYLTKAWRPLHKLHIDEVRRAHVVETLDDIAQERGKVSADRARTTLSAFFAWCIERGYCEASPVTHIKARNTNGSRERTLSAEELRDVWHAAGDEAYGRIIKLLILTGCRKTEIGDLRWAEINVEARQIELPSGRTKNKRPHIIPLSPLALALIGDLEPRSDREARPYVFGRYGSSGFSGWSQAKAELDQLITAARGGQPLKHWTIHDLRRTAVTMLHEKRLGDPHLIELIVNHVSGAKGGVAGFYDRSTRLEERRAALERWAEVIAQLVEPQQRQVPGSSGKALI